MLRLEAGRSRVLLMFGNPLLGSRGVLNPAWTAVIGDVPVVGDGVSFHHRPVVVGGVDDALIHVHDRGVVGKFVAAPLASGEANAHVAETVVHAAVVAHVAAPVAPMEPVVATVPVPVVRRPKRALIGSRDPGSGNPVVIPVTPGPVAGNPHQVGLRADGLIVDGQHGRGEADADNDL
jgi:hypothetical protein